MSFEVGGRPPRALVIGTGLSALLAVVFAVLLPLAPVFVNEPTVRWPLDPTRPASTMLTVTAYRPAELDVRFSCRAVRAASDTDHIATVVATINPVLPEAANLGLVVRVTDLPTSPSSGGSSGSGGSSSSGGSSGSGGGHTEQTLELTVDAVGSRLLSEPLPAGDCGYRVHGAPGDGLVVSRDGVEVGRGPAGVLPDVDMLVTAVAALPEATTADVGVALRLDDEFATSPTALKIVLIVLLALALAGVGVGLSQLDRAVPRVPTRWRFPRPHVADAAVVAATGLWMVVAPSTDDDGYYAAMATNSRLTGYVGNYYQLYDQSFTPITWFYQLLGWWQSVAGTTPVAQRALAVLAGLLTWCAVRAFVSSALRHGPRLTEAPVARSDTEPLTPAYSRLVEQLAPAVAAAAFLAWWLPSDMGVRPEGAVALLAVCALLGVRLAVRRQRLLAGFAASAAAGLALATSTTGFVGLAPLLVGLGGLWALVRVPDRWDRTAARALAVISGGTTGSLAGFSDGSLRDFLRAQQIFLDIQPREYWYTEYLRWFFLLGDGAMGGYAKRVAILVALVALVWFLVLAAASRGRDEPVPAALRLAGWSLIASFGLLWLTPSKWTHHFGALAGVGPVFLTLLLVTVVPLTRRVFAGARVPLPVVATAAGSVIVALAVAGHGRNLWPYGWLTELGGSTGFGDIAQPPDVGPFTFGSPMSWLVVLAGCVAASCLWTRRREPVVPDQPGLVDQPGQADHPDGAGDATADRWGPALLRGVALFVVVGLVLNVAYMLGSFTLVARDTTPTAPTSWSLRGTATPDPQAARCGTVDAVSVYDPFTATPLNQTAGIDPDPIEPATVTAGDSDGDLDPTTAASEPGSGSGSGVPERTGFERAGGYYVGYQPPVQLGSAAATTVWGSLLSRDGKAPDRNTAEMRTPWYWVPPGITADQAIAVLIAGSPNQGNSLTAEYGTIQGDRIVRTDGSTPVPAQPDPTQPSSQTAAQRDPSQRDNGQLDPGKGHTTELDDNGRDPRWRSVLLSPPPGAQVVRLHAVDDSAGAGGWLAFAAPAIQHLEPLRAVLGSRLGPDRPIALAWQIAFDYPCLRQPRIVDGITEPPAAAVLWADQPFSGTRDGTWLPFRGGIYGQVLRSQSVLQLPARIQGLPAERRVEVLIFDTRLPSNAYLLQIRGRPTAGWAQPVPTATRILNELEGCIQHAAATANPAQAARCVPKPVP